MVQILLGSSTSWIQVLSALLTPAVAVFAGLIAFQQFQINKHRLRLDLYEKRFQMYLAYKGLFIAIVVHEKGYPGHDIVQDFSRSISEMSFLFGDEIYKYFGEVKEEINKLMNAEIQLKRKGLTKRELKTEAQIKKEAVDWFGKQFRILEKKFLKYLSFKKNIISLMGGKMKLDQETIEYIRFAVIR